MLTFQMERLRVITITNSNMWRPYLVLIPNRMIKIFVRSTENVRCIQLVFCVSNFNKLSTYIEKCISIIFTQSR
uniref:Uncharacterized protein n=1 Tax=Pararge aegeria TaxID=116150 RepID=S4PT50_9NEOP